ncbi:hypothetical protein INT43_006436 [Umbelopsis isabellina]|uniref:Uncharacterized protein n=1 Tax=Mortierella isabellina TaxID=91625 RepID=A0A8H7Q0S4_MORIS|nr:hypothetical protein INT43_006436 [Umbelopsis isabellina]
MTNKLFDEPINRAQSDVRGWLDGLQDVRTTEQPCQPSQSRNQIANNLSQTNTVVKQVPRPKSVASMSSQDSVNLDDIIGANDTIDIQETGLLQSLEDLDFDDDENDEFWKLDESLAKLHLSSPLAFPTSKERSQMPSMLSSNKAKPVLMTMLSSSKEDNDTSSESSLNNQTIDDFDVDTYWHDSMKDDMDLKDDDIHLGLTKNTNFSRSIDSLSSDNTILANNGRFALTPSERTVAGSIPSNSHLYSGRSPSQSSETSFTSQSTIPASYTSGAAQTSPTSLRLSQSNSTSFRPSSRLSDHSVQSFGSASALPRPKLVPAEKLSGSKSFSARGTSMATKKATALQESHLLPRMSSRTSSSTSSQSASKLAKRASHIPAPSKSKVKPTPQKTLSSYSTGRDSPNRLATPVPKLPPGVSSLRMARTSTSLDKATAIKPLTTSTTVPNQPSRTQFSKPKQPSNSVNSQFLNDGERRGSSSMLPRKSITPGGRSPSRIGVLRKA